MSELFTIGHSVHTVEKFLELLKAHGITVLCDVRSSPYSRYTAQFNRETLKEELANARIAYLYLGAELGPRSADPACYENGKVQYSRLAGTEMFQQGLSRLRKGMATYRIALMCAEKDPLTCHRMLLICRNLRGDDVFIRHILEDGTLEDNRDTEKRLMKLLKIDPADLFSTEADQIQRAYDIQAEKVAYTLEEGQGTG
ncbi:MAG TPA: DUF488 domain-containing protein [Syntrophus sp. (in: bacteria)]|jgi:uncharacterized protein (DUF488 family)|nr:DUF488 domain-containing protein [Smithellaceae bacterium]HAR97662.1 DUF488 domain-containing protein [Syntrophus sp. (in: bacteria)]